MPWLGAMCVNQLFDTVTKYPEKLFKGRKGLFVLIVDSPPQRESREESQGRKLEAGTEAVVMEERCLLACSA